MPALFLLLPRWLVLTSLATFATGLLYLVHDYSARGIEIAELQAKVSSRITEVRVLEQSVAQYKDTVTILDSRLVARAGELDEFCSDLAAVRSSNAPEADKPVGEPLSSVLEILKKRENK